MKYLIIIICLIFTLYSCITPTFTVEECDNRFSSNKDQLFMSSGNRISVRSIVGGIHYNPLSTEGVYIDPFVAKDKTGKMVRLGLHITNNTHYDTQVGRDNLLGYIESIVFLFPDGSLVSLEVTSQRSSDGVVRYDSITGIASYSVFEYGTAYITKEQFKQIATAKQFSCKISGTYQPVIYETESDGAAVSYNIKRISPSFLINLNQFYQEYVK